MHILNEHWSSAFGIHHSKPYPMEPAKFVTCASNMRGLNACDNCQETEARISDQPVKSNIQTMQGAVFTEEAKKDRDEQEQSLQ